MSSRYKSRSKYHVAPKSRPHAPNHNMEGVGHTSIHLESGGGGGRNNSHRNLPDRNTGDPGGHHYKLGHRNAVTLASGAIPSLTKTNVHKTTSNSTENRSRAIVPSSKSSSRYRNQPSNSRPHVSNTPKLSGTSRHILPTPRSQYVPSTSHRTPSTTPRSQHVPSTTPRSQYVPSTSHRTPSTTPRSQHVPSTSHRTPSTTPLSQHVPSTSHRTPTTSTTASTSHSTYSKYPNMNAGSEEDVFRGLVRSKHSNHKSLPVYEKPHTQVQHEVSQSTAPNLNLSTYGYSVNARDTTRQKALHDAVDREGVDAVRSRMSFLISKYDSQPAVVKILYDDYEWVEKRDATIKTYQRFDSQREQTRQKIYQRMQEKSKSRHHTRTR